MARKRVPTAVETAVLVRSRRRCALCWGLEHDLRYKTIQIAHIDRDPSNNSESNLVALCQEHHDGYDTKPQQTKRLTPNEVRIYRDELYDIFDKKKRLVESRFVEPAREHLSSTNAHRLGLIVEAFDEDVKREKPNGLRLLHLIEQFIRVDGDFAAAQEGVRSLLRLIESEDTERVSRAAAYLLQQNELPVASPVVSLAKALVAIADVDGSLFPSLRYLTKEWAFLGESRGFNGVTIKDVPCSHTDALCSCLIGIANGVPVACDEWVQTTAIEDLVTLVCRVTIAYALQGFEFPNQIERIYNGHHGRVAPGPGFIGSDGKVDDHEEGRWPPDLWFNSMHKVARLGTPKFENAVAVIPTALSDLEDLFTGANDGEIKSMEDAKRLGDLWTTVWKGVAIGGRICLRNDSELGDVLAHVRNRRVTAENALAKLRRCLEDEHEILWRGRQQ